MSDTGRILAFPNRWKAEPPLSVDAAMEAARLYLENSGRSEAECEGSLGNPDVLAAICKNLQEVQNTNPRLVAEEASRAYEGLRASTGTHLFDERDYFLGELALLAAGAERFLGQRDKAERWLDRGEAAFRHTVNPAPPLAQVAYLRLAIRYDKRAHDEVLELLPSTLKSFERLGMRREIAKVRFLEAMVLKDCSREREAFEKFESLKESLADGTDAGLLGQVFVELGAFYSADGRQDEATNAYRSALALLASAKRMFAVAHLRMTFGEALRSQGQLVAALESFREGIQTYAELGMVTWAAYSRLILADALLASGRPREAEWQILTALPTIEEQKMVPEGFAAVALLRESVRQRQADPNALRELREHLQARN